MPRLTRIRVKNFKQYSSDVVVQLPASGARVVSLHGENGCGKSSLMDAIAWGLGAAPKQVGASKSSQLICKSSNKQAASQKGQRATAHGEVELQFSAGGSKHNVMTIFDDRGRKFKINGKSSSLAQLQQFVFSTLRLQTQPSLAAYIKQATTAGMLETSAATSKYLEDALGISGALKTLFTTAITSQKCAVAIQAAEAAILAARRHQGARSSNEIAGETINTAVQSTACIIHRVADESLRQVEGLLEEYNASSNEMQPEDTQVAEIWAGVSALLSSQVDGPSTTFEDLVSILQQEVERTERAQAAAEKADTLVTAAQQSALQAIQYAKASAASIENSAVTDPAHNAVETERGALKDQLREGLFRARASLKQPLKLLACATASEYCPQSLADAGLDASATAVPSTPALSSALESLGKESRAIRQRVGTALHLIRRVRFVAGGEQVVATMPDPVEMCAVVDAVVDAWKGGSGDVVHRKRLGSGSVEIRRSGAVVAVTFTATGASQEVAVADIASLQQLIESIWMEAVSAHYPPAAGRTGDTRHPVVRAHEVCRLQVDAMESADIAAIVQPTAHASAINTAKFLHGQLPVAELRRLAILAGVVMQDHKLRSAVCSSPAEAKKFFTKIGDRERVTAWPLSELKAKSIRHRETRVAAAAKQAGVSDPGTELVPAPGADSLGRFAADMILGRTCFATDDATAKTSISTAAGLRAVTTDGLTHAHGSVRQPPFPYGTASKKELAKHLSKSKSLMVMILLSAAEKQLLDALQAFALDRVTCSGLRAVLDGARELAALNDELAAVESQDRLIDKQYDDQEENADSDEQLQLQEALRDCLVELHKAGRLATSLASLQTAVSRAIKSTESAMLAERGSLQLAQVAEAAVAAVLKARSDCSKQLEQRDHELQTALQNARACLAQYTAAKEQLQTQQQVSSILNELQTKLTEVVEKVGRAPVPPDPAECVGKGLQDVLQGSQRMVRGGMSQAVTKATEKSFASLLATVRDKSRGSLAAPRAVKALQAAESCATRTSSILACIRAGTIPTVTVSDCIKQAHLALSHGRAALATLDSMPSGQDRVNHEAIAAESARLQKLYRQANMLKSLHEKKLVPRLQAMLESRRVDGIRGLNESLCELVPSMVPRHDVRVERGSEEDGGGFKLAVRRDGQTLSPSGLSGGQRSMVACALLLAVNRMHKSPLILLDEVDAALDATNRARFASILQEHPALADTQVLVISHHDLVRRVASHSIELEWKEGGGGRRVVASVKKNDVSG